VGLLLGFVGLQPSAASDSKHPAKIIDLLAIDNIKLLKIFPTYANNGVVIG